MAKLSDIAKVLIELRTSAIGKASFGIPMIAARLGAAFDRRVYTLESYSDAQDLTGSDGLTKLPAAVIEAAEEAFSQSPRIEKLILGNFYETYEETVTINKTGWTGSGATATAPSGTDFSFSIDGVSYNYSTPDATKKLADIVNAIDAKIVAAPVVTDKYNYVKDVTAGTFKLSVKKVGDIPLVVKGANTTVTEAATDLGTLDQQLNEIQGTDNTWYGFAVVGIKDSEQDVVAGWAEAAEPYVQFWTTSNTPAIWQQASGDVLDQLRNKSYERTVFTPSKNVGEYPHIAAMARFFVGEPGSIIAGLKTLTGVSFSAFTPDESKTILAKNGNTYERYAANVFLFNPGKSVSGKWVDEVRDRDWLVNYIQTSMASALMRAPKIPYTNPGITSLVNVLNGCLVYAQQKGVVAPDQLDALGNTVPGFVIDAPNALDVPFDVKASRVLTLKFTALLAGAIQKVEINGVLTYSYDGA